MIVLLAGLLCSHVSGCGKNEPTNDRGFMVKTYIDPRGAEDRYVVFIPYDYTEDERRPVLLFLNGGGENGNDGVRQISNNFGQPVWNMRDHFPFIAIAPQCRAGGSWSVGSPDTQRALAILDEVMQEYSTDSDRVYLTGVSAGGNGTWAIGSAYADRFAALVPLCGFPSGHLAELVRTNLPIWNIYNDGDHGSLVNSNRQFHEQLLTSGLSPHVSEYHQRSHNCWDRGYESILLYSWLLEQSRSRNVRERGAFQLLDPHQMLTEWDRHGTVEWTVNEKGHLRAGDDVGATGHVEGTENLLVSKAYPTDFEFHVDVAFPLDAQCRLLIMDGTDVQNSPGYELTLQHPETGSSGIHRNGGPWIAGVDAVGCYTFDPDGWNDLRIRVQNGQITVRINGWPSLEIDGSALSGPHSRIALSAPRSGQTVEWRYPRWRSLERKPSMEPKP